MKKIIKFLFLIFLFSIMIGSVSIYDIFFNDQKIKQTILPGKPVIIIDIKNSKKIIENIQTFIPIKLKNLIDIQDLNIPENITLMVIEEIKHNTPILRCIAKIQGELPPEIEVEITKYPLLIKGNNTYIGLHNISEKSIKRICKQIPKTKLDTNSIYIKIYPSYIESLVNTALSIYPQNTTVTQDLILEEIIKELNHIKSLELQIIFNNKNIQIDQITKVDLNTKIGKLLCIQKGKNIENVTDFLPLLNKNFIMSVNPEPIKNYLNHLNENKKIKEFLPFLKYTNTFINTWTGNIAIITSTQKNNKTIILESNITKEILNFGIKSIPEIKSSISSINSVDIISIEKYNTKNLELYIGITPPLILISNNKEELLAIIETFKISKKSPYNLSNMLNLKENQISRFHTKFNILGLKRETIIDTQITTFPKTEIIQSATKIKTL